MKNYVTFAAVRDCKYVKRGKISFLPDVSNVKIQFNVL